MSCCTISGTYCASSTPLQHPVHTTIDLPPPSYNDNDEEATNAFLQSLSSNLNLLTAGSLLLLPSILPFLASALTQADSSSYSTTAPSNAVYDSSPATTPSPTIVSGTTTTTAWTWGSTWIMLLPCLGIVVPLALFKIMATLEEHGVECPYKRWGQTRRRNNYTAVRRAMRQNNCRHGAADGPTLKAIKHVWGNLMKATTTPSSSFDDVDVEERDFLGYTPLLAHQDEASAEEGLCESVSEKSTPAASGKTMNFGRLHRRAGRESALPRPRHILLASLWAWTLLMTLSAKMGFNSVEQIAMTPSFPSGILANVDGSISSGSAGSAPISILSSPLNNNNHINNNQPLEGKFDWSSTGAVLSLVEMDNDTDMDALWAEDQSTAEILEGSQPFARIQTSIVIVNNDDSDDDENDDEVDMEDLSTLDALTMDPQDEAVFHDFLHQLDQEDDKAIRAAAAEASFEQAQDQQQQQQRRRRLFKATDDLMAASMLENDLPCGRSLSSSSSFRNNKWLVRIQQFLVGDSMTAADDGGHYSGRTFIYLGWSTDLMIVAVAMCLGGVLVGLAQSKALCHQLLDQQYLKESTSLKTLTQRRRRASWTTLLACLCLSGSALALTFLMIADKSWDVPAIYFVGIGIAGIILVHAWVPNAALPVHHTRDNIDSSDNDDDDSEDDEDTCIGSDSEDADHNNKLASHVFGTTPLAWSQPMTERRNACSLDENRRREVVAAATFH